MGIPTPSVPFSSADRPISDRITCGALAPTDVNVVEDNVLGAEFKLADVGAGGEEAPPVGTRGGGG